MAVVWQQELKRGHGAGDWACYIHVLWCFVDPGEDDIELVKDDINACFHAG